MTGFDSTWYHGAFAAGFMQSGDTWDLHFIAPQFLAWFYPANSEVLHAVGMNAFERDLLSPLLNLGWFVGCLVACWCIGQAVSGGALVAGPRGGRAERPRPVGPGGRGAQRHRRDLLPARRRGDRPQRRPRRGRGPGARPADRRPGPRRPRRRPGGRHQAQLPAARPRSSSSAWSRSRRAAGAWRRWRRPAWRRWPAAATGTCATSSTPATRCPGSTASGRSRCRRPTRRSAAAKRTACSPT